MFCQKSLEITTKHYAITYMLYTYTIIGICCHINRTRIARGWRDGDCDVFRLQQPKCLADQDNVLAEGNFSGPYGLNFHLLFALGVLVCWENAGFDVSNHFPVRPNHKEKNKLKCITAQIIIREHRM